MAGRNVFHEYPTPVGVTRPEWPEWAKDPHPLGRAATQGLITYLGDQPYTEPTPRNINVYDDFPLSQQDIALRSFAVRSAISEYIPGEAFEKWLGMFTSNLSLPAHQLSTSRTFSNILEQFNLPEPGEAAPASLIQDYIGRDDPNRLRQLLGMSTARFNAHRYPEAVLAVVLWQAAYRPYFDNLRAGFQAAQLGRNELLIADTVIERPLETFKSFVAFGTLLPLIITSYEQTAPSTGPVDHERMQAAITKAWQIFSEKRLLRRYFSTGVRMICPANHHLRYIKEHQLLEGLYEFVLDQAATPVIAGKLSETLATLGQATHNQVYYHWHYRAKAFRDNANARGGKGLELDGRSARN